MADEAALHHGRKLLALLPAEPGISELVQQLEGARQSWTKVQLRCLVRLVTIRVR